MVLLINVPWSRVGVLFMPLEAYGRTSSLSHTPLFLFSSMLCLPLIRVGADGRNRAAREMLLLPQRVGSGYFEVEAEDLMFLDYLRVFLCYVFLVVNSAIEKSEHAVSNFHFEWVIKLFRTITCNNNAFHFQQVTVYNVRVLCSSASQSQPTHSPVPFGGSLACS